MLSFTGSLKVYLALEPCDMRKSFNGLYGLVSVKEVGHPFMSGREKWMSVVSGLFFSFAPVHAVGIPPGGFHRHDPVRARASSPRTPAGQW